MRLEANSILNELPCSRPITSFVCHLVRLLTMPSISLCGVVKYVPKGEWHSDLHEGHSCLPSETSNIHFVVGIVSC